jgi:hypothetical protein
MRYHFLPLHQRSYRQVDRRLSLILLQFHRLLGDLKPGRLFEKSSS